jgi:hypothetical protein
MKLLSIARGCIATAAAISAAAYAADAAVPAQTASANTPPPSRAIYQQRRPDGSVVLSDRPASGMKTEREWAVEPEDPEKANARRDASRAESERVTERIQRSLDQQAERDAALEAHRLNAQQAADERKARDERQAMNEPTTIVVVPKQPIWPYPVRPLPAPVHKPVKPGPLPEPMLNVRP